ncbi:VCBS repeat-containing protein [Candidatus Acetothermia bacterium]|jgi:hypothetical protein|nr:VCBS repeat-containing protein [Candidatus Acetothermia bacterium]MCI2432430.1 VCBS repeat-containing protein [Candidatus Acetothermia bacterium]MCI2436313.1 VCBS repeat-containing protein [Candidatus Acetothermia bacterium]
MRSLVRLLLLGVGVLLGMGLAIAQPRPPVTLDFSDETRLRLESERDRSHWVRAADIDKDGDLDLIVGNRPGDSPLIKVLINDGQGRFKDDAGRRLPAIPSEIAFGADLGDLDNDGDLDIVLAMGSPTGGAPDRILINTGAGLYQDETATRFQGTVVINRSFAAKLCDIDGDGDLDLMIGTVQGDPARLWVNQGRGVFVEESGSRLPPTSFSVAALDCADADGDKDADVVWGTGDPVQGGLNQVNRILINNRGFFTDETAYRASFEQGTNTLAIKYLDVDGDGDLDLFACNDPGRAVLWINNGRGFFSDRTAEQLPFAVFGCRDFDFADYDGDGDLDLVIVRPQQSSVVVQQPNLLLINDGRGFFTAIELSVEGGNQGGNAILFKDLNGDKKPDIYIAREGQDVLLINKR